MLSERLLRMGFSGQKTDELLRNKTIRTNLEEILKNTESDNKLLVTQANHNASYDLTRLIVEGIIRSERAIIAVKDMNFAEAVELVKRNTFTDEEIKEMVETPDFKREMKKISEKCCFMEMKHVTKVVNEVIKNMKEEEKKTEKLEDLFSYGELSRIMPPEQIPQATEEIKREHLKRTGGKRVARFPPEPNGFLHIGHGKALFVNFTYASDNVYLRFDDTNPRAEKMCYYEGIIRDVDWLGVSPKYITASSDYFERMIEFGRRLIRDGKAYVCHLNADDIKKYRREDFVIETEERKGRVYDIFVKRNEIVARKMQRHPQCTCEGGKCELHAYDKEKRVDKVKKIKLSPYRNRSIETNLEIFEEMVEGKWEEGAATLRLKMDENSNDPFMLDLVAFRVINKTPHPITGRAFHVYPSYDFALCICDSLEDVTHSFCSLEFFTRQASYAWLVDSLGLYKAVQWEFSRLNIEDALLSKRKIKELINDKILSSYDDPRLFTLSGLRRRGVLPQSIMKLAEKVGVTFNDSTVSMKLFENIIREDLFTTAEKISCVIDPIECLIHENGNALKTIYISSTDFCETPSEDFHRLTPTQPVGVLNLGSFRFLSKEQNRIHLEPTQEKPLKYIQHVADLNNKVELRFYSNIIVNGEINNNSLSIVDGYCECKIKEFEVGDKLQLLRIGYFCVDSDSKKDKIVLNLTIGLKK